MTNQHNSLLAMDHRTRLSSLREHLRSVGLTNLWVTKAVNVRWICGFSGSNGQVLVTQANAVLITDGRYRSQASAELKRAMLDDHVAVNIGSAAPELVLAELVASHEDFASDPPELGFESDNVSVLRHEQLREALPQVRLTGKSGLIDGLRQIKDPGELARLQRASRIADRALADMLDSLRPGITERRFGADLDHRMRVLGADDVSFESIIASGPNSAIPHHRPGDRVLADGDLVVIDFGAKVDGYGSDMTRTVLVGDQPTPQQADLYAAVAAAQAAGVAAVRPGIPTKDIDAVCRRILEHDGFGDAFIHGTGHGLGLEIHEQPMLSSRSVDILRTGQVVTVEPGAYLPDFGGVRVEDSVVVTADGCEPLTLAPKGLVP